MRLDYIAAKQLGLAPGMVTHYIDVHRYLPPGVFVHAVLACPAMCSGEYYSEVEKRGYLIRSEEREFHARFLEELPAAMNGSHDDGDIFGSYDHLRP